jgi:CubicO group peptidase (beta-lactamase class C family)
MPRLKYFYIFFLAFILACNAQVIPVNAPPTQSSNSQVATQPDATSTSIASTPSEKPITPPPGVPQLAWQWPRSTPEAQGVSSSVLAAMLEKIYQDNRQIHSLLIIRHGVLILDVSVHPFRPETRHAVYSVTKSITATLVGIAHDKGILESVNKPVADFFPDLPIDDPRKKEITVENLLAMNSGVEWAEPLHSGLSDLWGILEASDPVEYFFTPALLAEPGEVFNYNSGSSHLLSIILQQETGSTGADFARRHLFTPLEITDFTWDKDYTRHTVGGTGLELQPVDMAKIGQLYLDNGRWQDEQILSADWIKTSTQIHSQPSPDVGYGYQWWLRPQGDYYALGWGGQQIRIFPKQDMVVVITAGESGEHILHNDLVDGYLIPAVQSNNPLPDNTAALKRLQTAVNALSTPRTFPSSEIPPKAYEVDGKQWLVTGRGDWSMFTLHQVNKTEAQLDLTLDGDSMPLKVGLDGTYRITETEECGPVAMLDVHRDVRRADDVAVVETDVLEPRRAGLGAEFQRRTDWHRRRPPVQP